MDHVTWATPLSGMISPPKANIWHSLQAHKILQLYFSSSRGISLVVKFYNASRGPDHAHLGIVRHLKVSTSRGQTVQKIWSL